MGIVIHRLFDRRSESIPPTPSKPHWSIMLESIREYAQAEESVHDAYIKKSPDFFLLFVDMKVNSKIFRHPVLLDL